MFSILHISDLHRSSHDTITNDTLVASLLADRDHYVTETPQIPSPSAIVVSGDLIHGAALGSDYEAEIRRQYEDTRDFLATLADRLLDGDRRQVVLVPGNHDCCWNTAFSAMRPVEPEHQPEDVRTALLEPGSTYRWSWKERRLYQVVDTDLYRRRLDAYWAFVDDFYRGTQLRFPIDSHRGFNLFDLDGGRVAVAAFESLNRNDLYSAPGVVADGLVSKCDLLLRDSHSRHRLRIAVWHHSIYGPPERSDYMDLKSVYEMIGSGFRLGLHGHQHYSQTTVHYLHHPDAAMAVVGAGSLCAGARELPRGIDRQYNVVVLEEELDGAKVHVREMGLGNHFGRTHRRALGVDGAVSLKWKLPSDAFGRPIDRVAESDRAVVAEAELAISQGDAARALNLLSRADRSPGSHARALYTKAAQMASRLDLLPAYLQEPANADELVALVQALRSSGDLTGARAAIGRDAERVRLAPSVRRDLEEHLELGEELGSHECPQS